LHYIRSFDIIADNYGNIKELHSRRIEYRAYSYGHQRTEKDRIHEAL
jgi:hypothetical protein